MILILQLDWSNSRSAAAQGKLIALLMGTGVDRHHLHLPSKSPRAPTFRLEVLTNEHEHSSPRGHSSQRSSSAANPEMSSRAFAPQPLNRADIIISRTKASSRPSIHLSSDSIPSSIRRNCRTVQRRVTVKQMHFPVSTLWSRFSTITAAAEVMPSFQNRPTHQSAQVGPTESGTAITRKWLMSPAKLHAITHTVAFVYLTALWTR